MKSIVSAHRGRPWRVHLLVRDFQLEDLWSFDLGDRPATDVREFLASFWNVMGGLSDHWLSKVRLRVGRTMKWDARDFTLPIPGCTETSVAARLDLDDRRRNLAAEDAPSPLETPRLKTVYVFREEALYEFSNDTIHGLLHLALFDTGVSLAVYVKHRGLASRVYMAAIWPARHWILYPSLIRKIEAAWRSAAEDRHR